MASTRGPIPKRSDQRRRANKTPGLEQAPGAAKVAIPPASRDWHPMARDLYRSFRTSGESVYFEPSDWATARVTCEFLSRQLLAEEPNAALISTLMGTLRDLLATEGARRRMSLELTRAPVDGGDAKQSEAEARVLSIARP